MNSFKDFLNELYDYFIDDDVIKLCVRWFFTITYMGLLIYWLV